MQASPSSCRPETQGDELFVAFMSAGRSFKARFAGELLDPAALALLHVVAHHAPLRLSDLALRLHLDLSTVSRHVRNLEELGLLTRGEDPADRRAAQVSLTPEGHTQLRGAMERRATAIFDAVADWPEDDRRTLVNLLNRFAAALGERSLKTETR